MKKNIKICILLAFAFNFISIEAQQNTKSYSLKKGQIFDVLLRSNNDKASQKAKDDFDKEVLPKALKLGYQLMPHGLYFEDVAKQGNYSPEHMVVGGWKSLEHREKAMITLENEVPNFHDIRRELWTTLFATYYTIEKDIKFNLHQEKYYVVTAYKHKHKRGFQKFLIQLEEHIQKSNGKIILKLRNGKSPFIGHYYEPNYFSITEWDSQDAFEIFLSKNKRINHASIKYVNQFILRPKF